MMVEEVMKIAHAIIVVQVMKIAYAMMVVQVMKTVYAMNVTMLARKAVQVMKVREVMKGEKVKERQSPNQEVLGHETMI